MHFTKKQLGLSALIMIAVIVVMSCFAAILSPHKISNTVIGEDAVGTLRDEDGTIIGENLSSGQWVARKGETLEISLQLPETSPYEGSVALSFYTYNAVVKVSLDGRTLAQSGTEEAEAGEMIGDMMTIADIPVSAFGKTLKITITSMELNPTSYRTDFVLSRAEDVRLIPVSRNRMMIFLFSSVACISIVLILMYVFLFLLRRRMPRGLFLFLFSLLLSLWYLGYHHAFYVYSTGTHFNAVIEYYAMYFAPVPLMAYLYTASSNRKFRKFTKGMGIAFLFWALLSVAVSASPLQQNLSSMIIGLRILIVVLGAGFVIRAVTLIRKPMTPEKLILDGLAVSIAVAMLEVVALFLRSVPGIPEFFQPLLYADYASIGILMYLLILYISYLSFVLQEMQDRIQREELSKLALVDQLTGIPNRAYLVHRTSKLKDLPEGFTAVFMDIDHLKMANDRYGHGMGDKLIRECAEMIRIAYQKSGTSGDLYGRWGGDEFVAYFDSRQMAEAFSEMLAEQLQECNEKHTFPFEASISIGMADGKEIKGERIKDVESLLDLADERMYCTKKENHEREAVV